MRIDYTQACPECQKSGVSGHLTFDTDNGKFVCTGETAHEFPEMPGENPTQAETEPAGEPVRNLTHFENEPAAPARDWTPEEEAALDAAMQVPPRPRDFGSQVVEAQDEVAVRENAAPAASNAQPEAILTPMRTCVVCHRQIEVGDLCVEHRGPTFDDLDTSPRVGLGESVRLENADMLIGLRIPERDISHLEASAETQNQTLGEHIQQLFELGLLDWHSSAPVPR